MHLEGLISTLVAISAPLSEQNNVHSSCAAGLWCRLRRGRRRQSDEEPFDAIDAKQLEAAGVPLQGDSEKDQGDLSARSALPSPILAAP